MNNIHVNDDAAYNTVLKLTEMRKAQLLLSNILDFISRYQSLKGIVAKCNEFTTRAKSLQE